MTSQKAKSQMPHRSGLPIITVQEAKERGYLYTSRNKIREELRKLGKLGSEDL